MMRMRVYLGIALLVASATSAAADWQYAKWGMTAAQIIAASKGEAHPYSGEGCAFTDQTAIARVPEKRIDKWVFEITFCTDGGGRLSSVALSPKPPENTYINLRASLLARYGRPIQDGSGDIFVVAWRDAKGGNLVRLSNLIGNGQIEYRAAPRGL